MHGINPLDYILVFVGSVNIIRIAFLLIGSDLYGLKLHFKKSKTEVSNFKPSVSVIIPAHNEEKTVLRALRSVINSSYPKENLEVVVVDDGSSDETYDKIENFIYKNPRKNIKAVRQKNLGKASALNNGIINHSKGEFVMCLDADSVLSKYAITKAVEKFKDPQVKGVSSNVKIMSDGTLFNFIQKMEYIVCYQMKRAHNFYNIEYIIGGIGSMFRRTTLEKVGYYDTNTVTEDIDLTMKILNLGNKKNRLIYGHDVVTYTESCMTMGALIRQRYRWKWGRSQTFYKNLKLFFNFDKKHNKGLTGIYLPFAIFFDFTFFFEPLLISYILFVTIYFADPFTLISAIIVLNTYVAINVFSENTLSIKERLAHTIFAPIMYFFFFVLSFAEYVALIKSVVRLHKLKESISGAGSYVWTHVERSGRTI